MRFHVLRFTFRRIIIRSEFDVFNFPTCKLYNEHYRAVNLFNAVSELEWCLNPDFIDSANPIDSTRQWMKKRKYIFTQFDAGDLLYKTRRWSDFEFIMRS